MFTKGDFVAINDRVGVILMTAAELSADLEDHTGVWFGDLENGIPEIWTIPTEYLEKGPDPVLRH